MAMSSSSLSFVGVLLCLFACSTCEHPTLFGRKALPPTLFCVAKDGAPVDKLQAFLDSHCGNIDCSAIQPGGECFQPNTVKSHASYALDFYYRTTKVCDWDIAIIIDKDPSYGNCNYL